MKLVIGAALLAIMATVPSTASAGFRSNDFLSPSGNISCQYAPGLAMTCGTFSNSRSITLFRSGRTIRWNNVAGLRHQAPRLAYNSFWQGGSFTCDSAESGITCYASNGRGFTIAREGISTF